MQKECIKLKYKKKVKKYMDIQSMFKIDNYTKLLKYQQQIKELREIENVRKIYIEFDFQYRERWIAQALSMYNKNTHKYFGNTETDDFQYRAIYSRLQKICPRWTNTSIKKRFIYESM